MASRHSILLKKLLLVGVPKVLGVRMGLWLGTLAVDVRLKLLVPIAFWSLVWQFKLWILSDRYFHGRLLSDSVGGVSGVLVPALSRLVPEFLLRGSCALLGTVLVHDVVLIGL